MAAPRFVRLGRSHAASIAWIPAALLQPAPADLVDAADLRAALD